MIDEKTTHLLADTLRACRITDEVPTEIVELPMPGQGYSGAQLRRFEARFSARGGEMTGVGLVVKSAGRVERRTLLHLYRQGHGCIPFCHTLDLERDAPEPLCMQYLPADPGAEESASAQSAGQAAAVASIHARNLREPRLREWLSPADGAFIRSGYVLGTFRPAWANALTDAAFRKEFGAASADLESAAERFVQDVEELWREGATLTLIHGDLHNGNVVVSAGKPYVVDWAQTHLGPYYLDLPNLFPGDQVRAYYQALADRGIAPDEQQFFERCRKMGRYVGFKYLGFVLSYWAQRDEPGSWVRGSLENLVNLAVGGGRIDGEVAGVEPGITA